MNLENIKTWCQAHQTGLMIGWCALGMLGLGIILGMNIPMPIFPAQPTPLPTPVLTSPGTTPNTQVITSAALHQLIEQAVDLKYIKTVLSFKPPLPLHGHPPALKPYHALANPSVILPTPNVNPEVVSPPRSSTAARCIHQGQAYLQGDIIKTPEGWVRCTGLDWESIQ